MPSGTSIDFRFCEKTGAATKEATMEHHTPCPINTMKQHKSRLTDYKQKSQYQCQKCEFI